MNGTTKDERYILKLYEMAKASGSPLNCKDRFEVGLALGLTDKVVTPLVNALAQANFVKKIGDKGVCLTIRGEELVRSLQKT